jgi:mono/diheme cytochrome c family protein
MTRKAGLTILGAVFLIAMAGLVPAAVSSASPTVIDSSVNFQDYGPLTEDMVTDEMIATGGGMFNSGSCQRCHMQGGQGGGRGPALTDDQWLHSEGDLEGIRSTIISGVAEDEFKAGDYPYPMYEMGGMEFDEDGLNALAAYVWSLTRD